jgi:hypothetical protein
LAAVCLPYLVAMGAVAAVHQDQAIGMRWYLAWYALLGIATVTLLVRATRGIGGWIAALWLTVAVGGAVSSLLVMPATGIANYASWPIGAVTPLLTLLVVVRPAWEATFALACELAGVAVLLVINAPAGVSAGTLAAVALPAFFSPTFGVLIGLILGHTIARLGRAAIQSNTRHAAVAVAEATENARTFVHRQRLADLSTEVLPFLRGIADGNLHPATPSVRRKASTLDLAMRDELHLPGVLDRRLRRLLEQARSAGCSVIVHADADTITTPGAVRTILATVLDNPQTPDEIVLSIHPQRSRVSLSLVILPGFAAHADDLRNALSDHALRIQHSPELVWAEFEIFEEGRLPLAR